MFPEIPSNLSELTAAELRALADQIRTAAEGLTRNDDGTERQPTNEEVSLARQALEIRRTMIVPLANRRDLEEALTDTDPDVVDPEVEEDDDDEDVEVVEEEAAAPVTTLARRKVHGTVGVETEAVSSGFTPNQLVAVDTINNVRAGDTLESWTQLAELMLSKRGSLRGNITEKFPVAKVEGNFTPDRILDDNKFFNLSRFDEEEMTAALCAPLTPVYTLACMNTTRRPVRASLATYRAPRFGVKIYPSPALSAVAGSAGIWTSDPRRHSVGRQRGLCDDRLRHPRRLPDVRRLLVPDRQEHARHVIPRTVGGLPQQGCGEPRADRRNPTVAVDGRDSPGNHRPRPRLRGVDPHLHPGDALPRPVPGAAALGRRGMGHVGAPLAADGDPHRPRPPQHP